MKKYFYSVGKEKHGPFSLDELKNIDINKDTLIWFEGLEDWTPASELQEMTPILELSPPPIKSNDVYSKPSDTLSIDEKARLLDEENKSTRDTKTEDTKAKVKSKQGMIARPFSFDGRIRRTELGISFIIYVFVAVIVNAIVESGEFLIIGLAYIPMLWFLWAQSAKRCHDLGNSGWFQIIPFYALWILFANGEKGVNKYGSNPKG